MSNTESKINLLSKLLDDLKLEPEVKNLLMLRSFPISKEESVSADILAEELKSDIDSIFKVHDGKEKLSRFIKIKAFLSLLGH